MVQRLIPGVGYVDETGSAQRLIPGIGYVQENQSSGVTISCSVGNATAAGVTASILGDITISCSVGNATAAGVTASISNSGNVTISCSVGNATAAGSSATITNNPIRIVTEPFINNTETGVLASTAVVWSWFPGGRIGALEGITVVDGTGTTGVDGTLIVTGLSAGDGLLLVADQVTDATDDAVFYYAGTVA